MGESLVVTAIPAGFRTITPYLLVKEVPALLQFMQSAFDAVVVAKEMRADGSIMHAEVRIGTSMLMTGEASESFGPMPASIYLYVEDCDRVYRKALDAGGVSVFDLADLPSGDRYGGVRDSSGNIWWIATHVEDVSSEEQQRRWALFQQKTS
jgi:PhnB protein